MYRTSVERIEHEVGRWSLRTPKARFEYQRLAPGRLFVRISGIDFGEFGSCTIDEVRGELENCRTLELFVDARAAVAVSVDVSRQWTRFFSEEQARLAHVSVLVGSRAIRLTMEIAQHLSRTGRLLQIHSDPALFLARMKP
jgi:hypothetical protein